MNLNILFILSVLYLGTITFLHIRSRKSDLQKKFVRGKIPHKLPDGLYHGSVPGSKRVKQTTGWKGKKFDAANAKGINIIEKNNQEKEMYPFVTSVGESVSDKGVQVVKIDYKISSNPWWLRLILDEIVETEPNHFLGKLQFNIAPGYYATIGYFELQK